MKLRHLLILGLLLFMNGFVCTVLFLMVSREMRRATAIPTEVPTIQPTPQSTFTATGTSTPTEVSAPTNTPVAPPTFTPVIAPRTPTATGTPAPATSTPTSQTTPSPTVSVPTSTPTTTSTSTATPTPTYGAYQYVGSTPHYEQNCQTTWIEGTVWDLTTFPKAGVTIRCWTYGQILGDKTTPTDTSKSEGYYEFILHEQSGVPREVVVEVAVVDAEGNLLSPRIMAHTTDTDCNNPNGRQRVVVDFIQVY